MSNLYLNRKKDETILIGDNIQVTVEKIGAKNVNLKISAPTEVRVKKAERNSSQQETIFKEVVCA